MTAIDSSLSRRFECEPGEVRAARVFVASNSVASNVPPVTIDDAALLVSELAANAVLHARTPFAVEIRVDPHCLRVEVVDADTSRPRRAPPARRGRRTPQPDPSAPSGRGLAIVDCLASRWGCIERPPGKRFWFELDY